MAFVDRVNSKITGCYVCAQYQGQEEVADNASEVTAYRSQKPPALTPTQRLESIGLTVADLKLLLSIA